MTNGERVQLWMCLKCGDNLCGRSVHQHALNHYQMNTVSKGCALAVNTTTYQVWCYACESYVSEPELDPVLNRCIELIKSKFNKGFHSQSIDRQTILVGTKCTHLQQSVDIQELHRIYGKRSDDTDSCVKCDDNIFNPYLWLCLKCGTELCGRSANGHALRHHNHKSQGNNLHALVMNTLTYDVWCYKCDAFVLNFEQMFPTCIDIVKSAQVPAKRSYRADCVHKKNSVDVSKLMAMFNRLDIESEYCRNCARTGNYLHDRFLWMCLKCGSNSCARFVNQHALEHYKAQPTEDHALAMNTTTCEVWCYPCQAWMSNTTAEMEKCVELVKRFLSKPKSILQVEVPMAKNSALPCVNNNVQHAQQTNLCVQICKRLENIGTLEYTEAEKLLRKFGRSVQCINICYDEFIEQRNPNELLLLVNRYCAGTLKTLKMSGVTMKGNINAAIKPLRDCIIELDLNECDLSDCVDVFPVGNKLKILRINNTKMGASNQLNRQFPHLEEIYTVNVDWNDATAREFIKMNMLNLKMVSIQASKISTSIFRSIATVQNLNTLEFDCFGNSYSGADVFPNLQCLGKLRSLKMLSLKSNFSIVPLLQKFVQNAIEIEELHFELPNVSDPMMKYLSELTHLKCLKLDIPNINENVIRLQVPLLKTLNRFLIWANRNSFQSFQVACIVMNLKCLTMLEIKHPHFRFDMNLYLSILKIMQQRDQELKIIIYANPDHDCLQVPQQVIKQNEKFLSVEVVNML